MIVIILIGGMALVYSLINILDTYCGCRFVFSGGTNHNVNVLVKYVL